MIYDLRPFVSILHIELDQFCEILEGPFSIVNDVF